MPYGQSECARNAQCARAALLGLLLRGQTPTQAADALGLDPAQAREMLAALARRSGVPGPRQLLVRALVHGWPLR